MDDTTQRYRDEHLPVTGEVGGEGGSFADPTYQETDDMPVEQEGLPRDRQGPKAGDVSGNAVRREEIAGGGVGSEPGPAGGMKKFPTE